MDRNQGRRMTAEEKLRIVEEGRLSGATISEVCRHPVLSLGEACQARSFRGTAQWHKEVQEGD
ncbi:transposase [Dehalococcoidia bacterium]|nr:transposase [Dehalococcoidia bacterium]